MCMNMLAWHLESVSCLTSTVSEVVSWQHALLHRSPIQPSFNIFIRERHIEKLIRKARRGILEAEHQWSHFNVLPHTYSNRKVDLQPAVRFDEAVASQ